MSVSLSGPFILESRKSKKLRPRKKAGLFCLCLAQQLSIFDLVIVPAELGFIPLDQDVDVKPADKRSLPFSFDLSLSGSGKWNLPHQGKSKGKKN